MDATPLPVVHHSRVWLARTEGWINGQVQSLPPDVVPHVVCESVMNLEQFPHPRLHPRRVSAPRRLVERALPSLHAAGDRRHLAKVLRQERAKVLHSHFGHVGWGDLPAAAAAGAAHVVAFYGHDASRLPKQDPVWTKRYEEMFAAADAILAEGPHMARRLRSMGAPTGKVHVQHLGVDLEATRFQPRQPPRKGEPIKALAVGRFVEKKGIPYAVAAVAELARRGIPIHLTIVGDADEQPRSKAEKAHILSIIRNEGIGGQVTLAGLMGRPELEALAASHHVLLAPSVSATDGDEEGGAPYILAEMAANGMVLVGSDHCDIPNVIVHGKTGLTAPQRDAEALADQLEWLAGHPEAWSKMTAAGRRRIEAEFDSRKLGVQLARLYHDVAGR
jgi:colanic acid/amylovoran biosynthesis glycosyltransferase